MAAIQSTGTASSPASRMLGQKLDSIPFSPYHRKRSVAAILATETFDAGSQPLTPPIVRPEAIRRRKA
jgi:hypothetical protein